MAGRCEINQSFLKKEWLVAVKTTEVFLKKRLVAVKLNEVFYS